MPKNLLQDMVKIKTVRNGEAGDEGMHDMKPEGVRPDINDRFSSFYNTINKRKDLNDVRQEREEDDINDIREPKSGGRSRNGLWFVALISVVFLFFALSFLFSSAKIIITPKSKDVSFDSKIFASKDSNSDDGLPFDLVSISDEEMGTITASGDEKDVSESSKGTVIIYNAFGSAPQNLDINTRLEGSNGKIYKTEKKTTVPGMKDGKPGSVEVRVYGSEPGADYNSGPIDFKVFGFKGTSKYEKFYARSKGSITGGLKGKFHTATDEEKKSVVDGLKISLQEKLLKKATDQIPDGFILFKDAVFLNIDDENIDFTSNQQEIPVSVKGTLYGFLFEEKGITKKIAETSISGYDGSAVHVENIKDLAFSISSKDAVSFKDVKNITFNLSGTPKIVWDVDLEKIASEVLGKRKKDFQEVLSQYPNIDSADLVIRPIWKGSFPEKSKDIEVVIDSAE